MVTGLTCSSGVTPLFLLVGLLGGLAAGALVVYRLISRFLASIED